MSIYTSKNKWKWGLLFAGSALVVLSLWYTNLLVRQVAGREQRNLIVWADAIRHRAELVQSTDKFFEQLKEEEHAKVALLAEATRKLVSSNDEDITFYSSIILNNKTIPVINTDANFRILGATNVDFDPDTMPYLTGEMKKKFTVYKPIKITSYGIDQYLFYTDSKHFTQLKNYIDNLISDFFSEVVINTASVPVIITDSTRSEILTYSNIQQEISKDTASLFKLIDKMASTNEPIELSFGKRKSYIFYQESPILVQLRYFPILQLIITIIFVAISYYLFSTARNSEQNRVWAGLAKETAHQLGTPLSSILAWVELLKINGQEEIAEEINKDAERLNTIAQRFSKIGSVPKLEEADLFNIVEEAITYLKKRTSDKVIFNITQPQQQIIMPISVSLFEWVIENICKNAIDAMNGKGSITIQFTEHNSECSIDISDTGKGIPRSMHKTIFNPGVTSKKRGWGLGLSLAKRIVEDVHRGKIFVKSSILNEGTTFRIVLNRDKLLSTAENYDKSK